MAKKIGILDYPLVAIDFTPRIPPIKKVKDKSKIDVRYCLISPFAYVHIYWDPKEYEVAYEIEEPILNKQEDLAREKIVKAMRSMINFKEII